MNLGTRVNSCLRLLDAQGRRGGRAQDLAIPGSLSQFRASTCGRAFRRAKRKRKIVGAGFLPDRPEATKTAPGFWARFLELYQREAREANR